MDSCAELSPALARVWHGSVMRDGAAPLSLSSHCYREETFNITAGLTHCPVGRGVPALHSVPRRRSQPYVNMVHFIVCVVNVHRRQVIRGEAVLSVWELDPSVNAHRRGGSGRSLRLSQSSEFHLLAGNMNKSELLKWWNHTFWGF